jgi:hypothetical protein
MADTKISALPSGAPAQAGDEYVIARGGANYKLTLTNIAASMPPIGATTPNTGAFTTLSASGVFTAKNGGSAAAPDITSAGDTNTGIFFPAADTIAFSEGGVETLRLTSTGAIAVNGAANYGTSGQVLTSTGNGPPSWQLPAGLPTMNIVSGTTQAAVANNHYVLTNASATTVTLPATPSAGDVVWVTAANGRTDNVIARNGSNINTLAENMTIDNAYAGVQLRYADATRGWIFT